MRLGGHIFKADTIEELERLTDKLDCYGLSTIPAPSKPAERDANFSHEFGEAARRLGILVGEAGFWENLLTDDKEVQGKRIETVRKMLVNAEAMGCPCVVTLVGTKDSSDRALAPHPYNYSDECRREFREIVLRILDGLDLSTTRYCIESWTSSFFYRPEEARAFIDTVDHPAFGLHLDQMNMISFDTFYKTTELIETTFDLLADKVAGVHLKDTKWDYPHLFLKWDECTIGDGVLDYDTYLRKLDTLDPDIPCFCEHMSEEHEYAVNFARLHHLADKAGVSFKRRDSQM
jgi:sugar phosphate isomerase/epimerase